VGVGLSIIRFRCPHCLQPLEPVDGGIVCASAHRFDRSRDGYYNLLPAGRLKGRPAGDSDDMIRARRTFFDGGHYQPIARAVAEVVGSPQHVLDAGCGEGQYIAAVKAPVRFGIDVSKPAISLASRRYRDVQFAVASSFRLPFDDATFDCVVSVFAPRPFDEFARVLRPDGAVVVASPGPDHLRGLTDLIYANPAPHEQRPHTTGESTRVSYDLTLNAADAVALLQMTPYWWKATAEQQTSVSSITTATIRVDVVVARITAAEARGLPTE
jgi:23S rRNA (guanine745-N1)-methyltransferase